jgi:hypothetical protein
LSKTEEDILTNFNGGIIECEKPNEILYNFIGKLTLNSKDIGFGMS